MLCASGLCGVAHGNVIYGTRQQALCVLPCSREAFVHADADESPPAVLWLFQRQHWKPPASLCSEDMLHPEVFLAHGGSQRVTLPLPPLSLHSGSFPAISGKWLLPGAVAVFFPQEACLASPRHGACLPHPAHLMLSPGAALGPATLLSSNITCSTACHPLGICLPGSRCSPACHRARHTGDAHEELQPDECPARVTAVHSLT